MRRLIINADDFGLTSGVNRAISEAHLSGVVTSATLMAAANCFDDAVEIARQLPKLSIGCHVILTDGIALQPATSISSLIQKQNGGSAPRFRDSLSAFAAAALTGQIDASHVEAEATAQIRKLQSSGMAVSHLDTHKHTHVFPAVLAALLRAARACGVRSIRNPFVVASTLPRYVLHKTAMLKRYIQVQLLRTAMSSWFRKQVERAGLVTPDGSLGIIETGFLDRLMLDQIIDSVPDGTWELVCHPGYADDQLAQVRTRLRESRAQELALLTSPATRERFTKRGIQLISYWDLLE